MRLKATVLVMLKALLAQWKQVLLMYAIFPLLLATAMGYFQKDVFKPETSMEKINITIMDEDNSSSSKEFVQLFKVDGIKELFNITNEGEYLITIPKGYEDSILKLEDVKITIDEKERVSRSNELIIKAIIEQYGKHQTQSLLIWNKIDAMNLADKEKLYSDVVSSINNAVSKIAVRENIIKGERKLNSYENQAAALMTYMVMMMIMGCVAGHHMDIENGSFKRLISTPIKKTTMFNLNFATFFVISFIYGLIYVVTLRAAGYAFKGVGILNIAALLFGQSILISAFSGLMTAFFKKQNANIIMIIVLYYQIIFGGVFIPLKNITNKVFMMLTRFSPGNVISGAYRNLLLFDSFNQISEYLVIMLLVSMAVYVISILKVRIRWEG